MGCTSIFCFCFFFILLDVKDSTFPLGSNVLLIIKEIGRGQRYTENHKFKAISALAGKSCGNLESFEKKSSAKNCCLHRDNFF